MRVEIPASEKQVDLEAGRRTVRLTNLQKLFWPELGITNRDLLQYYADVGTKLLRWRPDKKPRQCTMKQVERDTRSPLNLLKAG